MRTPKTPSKVVRIGPRISRSTYALAKAVYGVKGVTLESRIEFLLRRDLKKEINKPWFKDGMKNLGESMDLPEGMIWEDFWMRWMLSEEGVKS